MFSIKAWMTPLPLSYAFYMSNPGLDAGFSKRPSKSKPTAPTSSFVRKHKKTKTKS